MRRPVALRLAALIALPLALALPHATPAAGASFAVNSTVDAVDANPGDGACADATGVCTLRAAVMETNALPGADAITLPAGTYVLTLLGGGPRLQHESVIQPAGSEGPLAITESLTVAGAGASSATVKGPSPAYGGVFALPFTYPPPSVTLSDLAIRNGLSQGGGGIRNDNSSLTLARVILSHNSADGSNGGGVYNGGSLTVAGSSIDNNDGQRGGGIYNTSTGTAAVTNTTFSANTAVMQGGATFNLGSAAVALTNVTIMGHSTRSDNVGGVVGPTQLKNTVLLDSDPGPNCGYGVDSLGHNLSSDASCGLTGPGDLQNVDPKLGPLADNGGPTQTHALLPGSPAIDAGDNSGCPATDQRGVARPQGAACDIGAYEYQPPAPTPPPAPTAPPAAAATPTLAATDTPMPSPSPTPVLTRLPTPRRPRTPTLSPSPAAHGSGSEGGSTALPIALGALAVVGLAGGAAGGGYYYWLKIKKNAEKPQ